MQKKIIVFFILLSTFLNNSYSQEQISNLDKANQLFLLGNYFEAAKFYKNEIENSKKNNIDLLNKSAICYEKYNDYTNAIFILEKIQSLNKMNDSNFELLGDMYKCVKNYKAAKENYKRISNYQNNKLIYQKLIGCDSAIIWNQYKNDKIYNLKNANSDKSEYGPKFYINNNLVFNTDNLNENIISLELYRKQKKEFEWTGGNFQKLVLIKNLGSETNKIYNFSSTLNDMNYHVSDIVFNIDYTKAYITYTVNNEKYIKTNSSIYKNHNIKKLRSLKLVIYESKKVNGEWTQPVSLNINKPEEYNVCHPALSYDENFLFFSSDRPDGYGKNDIWYCKKNANGLWSEPINCGNIINTSEEEDFPFIDYEGSLYFSSKGHIGIGGLDIFKSTYKNNKWSEPENLKSPINSEADDFSYCQSLEKKEYGFIASNRLGGLGNDDIWGFIKNQKNTDDKNLFLVVTEEETNKPLSNVKISSYDIEDKTTQTKYTDALGHAYLPLKVGKTYDLTIDKDTYRPYNNSVSVMPFDNDSNKLNVSMIKQLQYRSYKEGDQFVLKNLYYDFDKFNIRPDASLILNELVILMIEKYPNMKIQLQSNTDSRGSAEYNLKLSQERANAAYNYLVKQGINPSRIKRVGLGETNPVNKCVDGVSCNEEMYELNRRTEIKVLSL